MWKRTSSGRSLEVSLEGLRESISSLKDAKDEVSTKVWISEVGGMVPTSEVRTWLRDARVAEQAARDLLTESELTTSLHHHSKSSLIIGCCAAPRYSFSTHQLQQQIARTLAKVDQLIEARPTFDAPLGMGMGCSSPSLVDDDDTTVGLESVFEQVWASLMVMDEERRRCGITIGLWGMGGIGKTSLLRKIKNALHCRNHDFDMVIWVSVAKTSTEEEIQDYILRRLQLHQQQQPQDHHRSSSSVPVPNKIPRGEKSAIINAFMKGKRCVLLLDDVWERIDLREVGIPFPKDDDDDGIDSTATAAVIFTTRSRNLCDSMDADRVFEIGVLSQEQAWRLFTMKVGGDAALNPDTIDLARQVVEECGGNPLALATLGHSMANKNTPQEWRLALHKLRSPAYDDDDDAFGRSIYSVVKRSYESLSTDAVRECFIHCSLFTKGSPIDKNQLLDYWIGEGFLNELSDGERDARSVGFSVLGELVSASLLQLDDIDSSVKMHDLIHDVALWIASDCGTNKGNFFVQAGVNLAEVPKFLNWRLAKRVSLMDNCIEELDNFTEESDDPLPLLTLFLSKNRFAFISNNFFANMPSLRTLDLSWSKLAELPLAICGLIALQYLNLSHTYISELPKSIQKLVSLEVFDLSYTSVLYRFPTRVLSSLSSLQTLNMLYCGHSNWNEEGPDLYIDTVGFLEELESLPLLNDLSLNIKRKIAFDKLRSSKKLPGCTRSLSVVQCKGLTSIPLSSIQFMTCLDTIEVRNCQDLEEFEIDCFVGEKKISRRFMSKVYFKSLQHVTIRDCWSLKNLTWLSFTPNLESLRVERCMKLEEIISGHVSADWDVEEASRTFQRLKRLYLGYLPELRLISDIALEFPALEEITVVFCAELKRLPVDRKIGLRNLKMIKGNINWWDGLQWEVEEEEDKSNKFSRYFTEIEV